MFFLMECNLLHVIKQMHIMQVCVFNGIEFNTLQPKKYKNACRFLDVNIFFLKNHYKQSYEMLSFFRMKKKEKNKRSEERRVGKECS